MKTYLGSAPDSWGVWFANDAKQPPWQQFLDEVREAGYQITELGPYGYLPTDPSELNAELHKRGLTCVASMIVANLTAPNAIDTFRHEFDPTCKLLLATGARFIGIIEECYTDLFTGRKIVDPELTDDQWKTLVANVETLGRIAAEQYNLTLLYHHHADTHVEYDRQAERLLADTNPKFVSLVLDTGHLAYRDGDSAAFMRAHHQRIPYLHVKSVDRTVRDRIKAENLPFAVAVAGDLFCEPSIGDVDFVDFRQALEEVDYEGYVIVEQDMYPAPFSKPLPIARRTFKYLSDLGFGN